MKRKLGECFLKNIFRFQTYTVLKVDNCDLIFTLASALRFCYGNSYTNEAGQTSPFIVQMGGRLGRCSFVTNVHN